MNDIIIQTKIEHLASIKKFVEKQISFYEEILETSQKIINNFSLIDEDYSNIFFEFEKTNEKKKFINKIGSLKDFLTKIINKLNEICKHNYITDFIDIDENESKIIKYCDKCWNTF
jgi:Zn-dependent M32 family carboxypeptidase